MKKNLLLLVVTLITASAFAQPCVPDPMYTLPGIYPDSATGFSDACVGDFYEQVITNIVPVDTTVDNPLGPPFPPITLQFDSIVIISFTGLPASMSYACATTLGGCSFAGGEAGCVLISGTPTAGEIGTHNLVITVDVYVGGLGTPQATEVIDWYFIEVEDVPAISFNGTTLTSSNPNNNQWYMNGGILAGETGQDFVPTSNGTYTLEGNCGTSTDFILDDLGISASALSKFKLYPNPTENTLTLDGLNANTVSITITNASGQLMNTFSSITSSSMELNVEDLESGIYFVRINDNDGSEVIRFVKK